MGIGTPQSVGTAVANADTSSTLVLTTATAILSGDLVVWGVGSSHSPNIGTVTSVTDGTNTYTTAITQTGGSVNQEGEVWYVQNAAAVSSAATVTFTFSITGYNGLAAAGLRVPGIVTSSALDKTGVGPGTATTTPTAATGTLAQATEIVIGLMTGGGSTITVGSGFTSPAGSINSANTNQFLMLAYEIVASTNSVTWAPSQGAANTETCMVASFKGTASTGFMFDLSNPLR